ncbi:hypothetical protein [Streptomyces sp. NPDC002845]
MIVDYGRVAGNEARAAIINDRRITGLSADVIAELVAELSPLWHERHQAKLASRPRKRAMGAGAKHRLVFVDRHLDEGRLAQGRPVRRASRLRLRQGRPTPTRPRHPVKTGNAKRWDAQSGMHDMGFRDYNPGLNHFTTRDMYNGALADMNQG